MPSPRTPRASLRAAYWRQQIQQAPDGETALGKAWQWIRSELRRMAEQRPADAEQTRRDLAGQLAQIAEQLPAHKPGRR